MMKGKIIGWNFTKGMKRTYNADGGTTLEMLTAEKTRLETRLVEIPKLIAQLHHSVNVIQKDINWLGSLSNMKRKKWEKENGKSIGTAQHEGANAITKMKGQITSMTQEKSRIPDQIKSIDSQLTALVKGEATGLEKGIDKETARELGEIELQKERDRMAHERALREAELEQQQLAAAAAEKEKQGKAQNKVWIVLGVIVLLAIAGYIVYKRRKAKIQVA